MELAPVARASYNADAKEATASASLQAVAREGRKRARVTDLPVRANPIEPIATEG